MVIATADALGYVAEEYPDADLQAILSAQFGDTKELEWNLLLDVVEPWWEKKFSVNYPAPGRFGDRSIEGLVSIH